SGVNLLNIGAINVGNNHRISSLNTIQVTHASHTQLVPVLPIIQSTAAAKGVPSSSTTNSVLMLSATNSAGVIRLKPKRASMTNLRHTVKGRPITPIISSTPPISIS